MKLLIAEDDPELREQLGELTVEAGYQTVLASDGREAWQVLSRPNGPVLCLLDWAMPEMDGLEVCERLRSTEGQPYVYVVMLTGHVERGDAVRALEAGADDYIQKPFDAEELLARLRAGRRIVELQEALRTRATRDGLTGLWNRGAALDALERELARAERAHTPVAVAMGDIDHFKQINDRHGHDAGDEVLRAVCAELPNALRASDAVARYGGDELLLILPGCGSMAASRAAERALHRVSARSVQLPTGSVKVTMSFGVVSSDMGRNASASSLVRAADQALYRAKANGRDCVALGVLPRSAPGGNGDPAAHS